MQRRNRCCFRVSEDIFVVCVLTGAVRLDSNGEMCDSNGEMCASYPIVCQCCSLKNEQQNQSRP